MSTSFPRRKPAASPGRKAGRGLTQYAFLLTVSSSQTRKGGAVKQSEFRRWLESQGVVVKDGTNHLKLYRDGRQSTMPRYPSKEINEKLRTAILKQLGI